MSLVLVLLSRRWTCYVGDGDVEGVGNHNSILLLSLSSPPPFLWLFLSIPTKDRIFTPPPVHHRFSLLSSPLPSHFSAFLWILLFHFRQLILSLLQLLYGISFSSLELFNIFCFIRCGAICLLHNSSERSIHYFILEVFHSIEIDSEEGGSDNSFLFLFGGESIQMIPFGFSVFGFRNSLIPSFRIRSFMIYITRV